MTANTLDLEFILSKTFILVYLFFFKPKIMSKIAEARKALLCI